MGDGDHGIARLASGSPSRLRSPFLCFLRGEEVQLSLRSWVVQLLAAPVPDRRGYLPWPVFAPPCGGGLMQILLISGAGSRD